jgi:flap endonuclease-1
MCILCGCDYVPKISGIGPVKAYKLIEEYRTMEKVLEYLYGENKGCEEGKNKYGMPKG